jgi:alkaline phosphatase
LSCLQKNNGYPYADTSRSLQLLIDLKTEGVSTLKKLVELIEKYPALKASKLYWVITGNRPASFSEYPPYIWFDGDIYEKYSDANMQRIKLLSGNLKKLTNWNGKGVIPEPGATAVKNMVQQVHAMNKPIRFWDAPDVINAWYKLMEVGVDFINTDHIAELSSFLKKLPTTSFINNAFYSTYQPSYKSDGANAKPKNVILLIADGTGLPQLYAGYTANKGNFNIFKMLNTGMSKTSSEDDYITDSAAGATAYASGKKTKNRFIGVDKTGVALPLIPLYVQKKRMSSGLITSGEITGATPASFYAHRVDRDSSYGILQDLVTSPVDVLMGAGVKEMDASLTARLKENGVTLVTAVENITSSSSAKLLVVDSTANLSILNGRGNWLQKAFEGTVHTLSRNKNGFFMMAEGAQVDNGGHNNNLPYVVTEAMDFDRMVGKALEFADKNGETLVIVTADHETGGLTLLNGDISKGSVSGQFSTNDHTGIPVPVFAYGPQSQLFRGVYENTEVFTKILKALGD